ncbi:MAG: glycine cleavage T C-terminal barrel domain-containing protein, partial [Anaerolineae bacterium]
FPGGHLAYERQPTPLDGESVPPYRLAERLAAQVTAQPNIRFEPNTTAFGIYPHLWVGASQNDRRLFKIRARSLVIANGAFEQPLLFHNSDRPGVVLGSAAQRLMHLYAVKPGRRAVVLSANRDGLAVALDLHAAGVHVAAVVELRPHPNPDLSAQLREAGIPLHTDRIIAEARGSRELTGVMLAEADTVSRDVPGGIRPKRGTLRFVPCDLLAVSIGWTPATGLLYQAKAKLAYNEARREFLPVQFPPHVFAAGRVNGTHTLQAELLEGEIAGRGAAAAAGFGDGPGPQQQDDVAARKAEEPVRTAGVIYIPGGKKQFISFDEDVSVQDLRDSIAEGYNSMELLKRYSTLSMGPSQGKYESANTMALCAEANDQPISEVGTTTSRPPFTAVPLGVLAGRKMEPVKYTPMHGWHAARGAKMMNAGLWKRPEHYGDPIAEVRATRHSLGLIDVSTLGKIQLRGADVPKLLERLYTNRWLKLAEGRARYGVMLNEEGVVFNDGVTAHLKGDNWYMTTTTGGAAAVYEMITWYLQSGWNFDVRLCDLADTFAAINLTGPVARRILQPLTDVDLRNDAFPYMGAREGTVAGVPATILRIGFTGELGYEMHVPAGYALYLWETLLEASREAGITPFGVEAQRVMRLEKGHFIVGQDTDALTNPFMAHLDWAVKMEKDDFWGKPSLARVQKRGLHQRLVGYKMRHPEIVPEEANQIVRPNPEWPIGLEILGRVTSARYSPTLNESIGLCWLPVDMARPGVEFTVRVRGELHPGVVVPTPFYDPEGKRLRS